MAVVIWSDRAKQDLRSIHSFNYVNASPEYAARTLKDIVDAADVLEELPRIAPEEMDYKDLGEIRGLLIKRKGNIPRYKLMYKVEEDACYILAVWDTRQNPADELHVISVGLSN